MHWCHLALMSSLTFVLLWQPPECQSPAIVTDGDWDGVIAYFSKGQILMSQHHEALT